MSSRIIAIEIIKEVIEKNIPLKILVNQSFQMQLMFFCTFEIAIFF